MDFGLYGGPGTNPPGNTERRLYTHNTYIHYDIHYTLDVIYYTLYIRKYNSVSINISNLYLYI